MILKFPNGLRLRKDRIDEVDISDDIVDGRHAVIVTYKPLKDKKNRLHFSLTPTEVNQFMESQCQS